MKRREKILLAAFVAVFLLSSAIPQFERVFLAPLDSRRARIQNLDDTLKQKGDQRYNIRRSRIELAKWSEQSLPADALDAQRLYQAWLTDMAHMAGFTDLTVTPALRLNSGEVYTPVRVTIEGKATFERLCQFLYRFYQADVLHRVTELKVESEKHEANSPLDINMIVEGLSLKSAKEHDRLFVRTTLTSDLAAGDTEFTVDSIEAFPEDLEFRVRIDNELITVNETDEGKWKVTRGVDATTAAEHAEGAIIELAATRSGGQQHTLSDLEGLIARSPFVKPEPDKTAVPTLEKIGDQKVYIGQTLAFTAKVPDVYKPKSKLKFTLAKGGPEKAKIDKSSGEFTWTPGDDTKPGDVHVTVEVVDGSAKKLTATEKIKITVSKDEAAATYFAAYFEGAQRRLAHLYDRESKKTTVIKVGSEISVADVKGRVLEVGEDGIILERDGKKWRLPRGQNLRSIEAYAQDESPAVESDTSAPADAP